MTGGYGEGEAFRRTLLLLPILAVLFVWCFLGAEGGGGGGRRGRDEERTTTWGRHVSGPRRVGLRGAAGGRFPGVWLRGGGRDEDSDEIIGLSDGSGGGGRGSSGGAAEGGNRPVVGIKKSIGGVNFDALEAMEAREERRAGGGGGGAATQGFPTSGGYHGFTV